MEHQDYYERLGVNRDTPHDEIKRAYRKLARKYHPDVSKEDDAEAKFKQVQEAWDVLGDPEKRTAYDQLGTKQQQGEPFQPPPDWARGAGDDGFGSVFEDLFGGGGNFRGFSRAQQVRVNLTLDEAWRGCEQQVAWESVKQTADGRLSPHHNSLKVRIPAGVGDGEQLRVKTKDGVELLVQIHIAPHPHFVVDGHDLLVNVSVPAWTAALGGKINVPTMDGRIKLSVPAGTANGAKLRAKGKGLSPKRGGNLNVVVNISAPAASNDKERKAWENLRDAYEGTHQGTKA